MFFLRGGTRMQDEHLKCSKHGKVGHTGDANPNSAHNKGSLLNAPLPTQSNLPLGRTKGSQTKIRDDSALKYSMGCPRLLCPQQLDWRLWFVLVIWKERVTSGTKRGKVGTTSPNTHVAAVVMMEDSCGAAEQEGQSSLDHWVTAWRVAGWESCPNPQSSLHQ